jgi:hypothetical protein
MILKEDAMCIGNHPLSGALAARVCAVVVCFGMIDLVCAVVALVR